MITMAEYWMGREREYPQDLTDAIRENAEKTVERANFLLQAFSQSTKDYFVRRVNSGWRPPSLNAKTPGAALRSKHMTGEAIDIADPDGDLDDWCIRNPTVMADIGLWQEHPASTKGWCHVQIVPPKSGNRVFYP